MYWFNVFVGVFNVSFCWVCDKSGGCSFAQCWCHLVHLKPQTNEDVRDIKPQPTRRSASECSRFRSRTNFWPYLGHIKISWWYLKRFKSFRVDKQTNKQTNTFTNRRYWKQPTSLPYRCAGIQGNKASRCWHCFEINAGMSTLLHVKTNNNVLI